LAVAALHVDNINDATLPPPAVGELKGMPQLATTGFAMGENHANRPSQLVFSLKPNQSNPL
jgi:hypothetical protein